MRQGDAVWGPAVRRVVASELRRRWRALVVLGLLVGVASGVAMAAAAGARRSDTAYDRLIADTRAADAAVFASQQGVFDPDVSKIQALPYVEAAGSFSIPFFEGNACVMAASEDWLVDVDRPHLLAGRRPALDDPNEVLLAPPLDPTEDVGLDIGDTVTIHLYSAEQANAPDPGGPPAGPTATLQIVGSSRSTFEMGTIADTKGCLFAGPAFLDHYDLHPVVFHNPMVRLANGARDIPRLETDLKRLLGIEIPVEDLAVNTKRVTNGTDLERTGLALFAIAVAVAAILIVGQALTRSVRAAAGDLPALRAIGLSPSGIGWVLVVPHLVVVGTAVVVALVLAIGLSPRFPIGLSRRVDPDLGVHADLLVLAGGLVVLVVLLVLATAITARAAARQLSREPWQRPSTVASALTSFGAPLPARIGASLALESGRGARALPTRPALLGTIVGVLGVIGALTLAGGIDDAISEPERFGMSWDLQVFDYSGGDLREAVSAVDGDPDVTGAAILRKFNLPLGDASLPTHSIDPIAGDLDFAVLSGRRPERSGEVALAPATADALDLGIGDQIEMGTARARLTVVGIGLVPQSPHSQFDQGAWVTPAQGEELGAAEPFQEFNFPLLALRLRDDVVPETKVQELSEGPLAAFQVELPAQIPDQENMRGVRPLPVLFASFTAVLALGALAHVGASVLRRRRGDLAVLRALGVTPRQAGWCLSWQATVLGLIGVVAGVPLGMAAGRAVWRSVAEATPMVYVAPAALAAVLLALPVTLVLANLIASIPGWRATRLRPGEVLRTE